MGFMGMVFVGAVLQALGDETAGGRDLGSAYLVLHGSCDMGRSERLRLPQGALSLQLR
jgi:hypothetical protein